MPAFLLAALLGAGAAAAGPQADAPLASSGPAASVGRLGKAYRAAKNPDERFWIVDALEGILESRRDEAALTPLLEASRDSTPDVRRRALSALEGWRGLSGPARERWRVRVAQAASLAGKDRAPRVREAGESLSGALVRPAAPAAGPAPAPETGRGKMAAQGALWAVCLQLALLAWLRLGTALLSEGKKGSFALRWLSALASRPDYLVFPCMSAAALLLFLGLGEGLAFVRVLSPVFRPAGLAARASWAVVCLAASALSITVPSSLLARRAGRGSPPQGALRAAFGSLRDLPSGAATGALLLVLAPVTVIYRAFGSGAPESAWQWLASAGAPAAYFAAACGARGGEGWPAGLSRAWRLDGFRAEGDWLTRPWSQAPLVLLCLSAPVVFAVALLPVLWLAGPGALADGWRVPEAELVVVFATWAGSMAVAVLLAFGSAAAALYAAALSREGA